MWDRYSTAPPLLILSIMSLVACFIISFFSVKEYNDLNDNILTNKPVDALITNISTTEIADSYYNYDITVCYQLDGKDHTATVSANYCDFVVGQKTRLVVNPDNLSQVDILYIDYAPLFVLLFDIPFLATAIILFILYVIRCNREKLRTDGLSVMAVITAIKYIRSSDNQSSRARTTYYVTCDWTDDYGTIHHLKSFSTYSNLFKTLDGLSEIEVFVDPQNFKKYLVNV